MQHQKNLALVSCFLTVLFLSGCAVSPETQARMDEYDRTIPVCSNESDCQRLWQVARNWAINNADFPILTEGENRVMATSTLTTNSGIGVVVTREGNNGGDQILVDVECFSAYGCPNIWDLKLDFNRTVNDASR